MSSPRYALGLDFGTNSCRALVVDLEHGVEVAEESFSYPSGNDGVLEGNGAHVARQHPADYLLGLNRSIGGVLRAAADVDAGFDPAAIIGVGIATTGSTPIPVDAHVQPLAVKPEFVDDIDAMAWLWKDHTARDEAEAITQAARATRPEYVQMCGGVYSAEWFWAKIWRCLRVAPHVFEAADSWVELCDFLPAVLIGVTDTADVPRSICAAGHKAMFSERWGGLPDAEFLAALDPGLAELRPRLYSTALDAGRFAGGLSAEWSARTGLREGTPVAVGAFDSHAAALGAGVAAGVIVTVLGTSTCDVTVQPVAQAIDELPGVCGIVPGSVLPGYVGIEAGQSGVGDMFRWFAERFVSDADGATVGESLSALSNRASLLAPGEHGLVALDWVNGNRSILVDHRLSGAILGLNLQTEAHHVLQALIEATAFGALRIVDRLEEFGVPVNEIVATGGLPGRNPALMQAYADVLERPIRVAASAQCSALGAAMLAAVAAGAHGGGFATAEEAQEHMVRFRDGEYLPRAEASEVYRRLYSIYCRLHDAFGLPGGDEGLGSIMRELLDLRSGGAVVGAAGG
jgi:L-ribulokinase